MELVELTPLSGALVGLPGIDGLSTEQRKRLTITVELVSNPSIVFMDEPTSGLDARAAAIVMRTMRNIVNTGRTIVCTIHQPSIDIFESFDELLFMKRGGELIYASPLGPKSSELIISYFEAIEGVQKIRYGYNPATWMLEYFCRETQQDLFNAMGSMYSAILFISITNGTAVQPVVSVERFVSYRERAAGMYSALSFAFAQVVIEFPYVFAQAMIYSTIFYSMASFVWTVDRFIWYLFFMYFTMLYFTFYGMMTMAVTPNHNVDHCCSILYVVEPFHWFYDSSQGMETDTYCFFMESLVEN
ncbi:ABC transporter G family member 31 [Cajanus cajan]|uniref:ABC transporter G family member 31 n=1 Tax=Cajanus cajan TaxID=3821 RepID=UPI00098DA301|nr:ABC transporter G family member 31 isoform X1 [Cajanus cajan]XP_029126058.1 ABC transporter G family member 31 [Cajanus cajan]